MAIKTVTCLTMLASLALADFSLYPSVDQDRLAKAFGITNECLTALNSTVTCDRDLFGMASSVDSYHWEADNVTALCTPDCTDSASKWVDSVKKDCANQAMNVQGKMVPVESVPGRYLEGTQVACLQSDNKTSCFLESQDWKGSDIIRPEGVDDPASDPENTRIANLYGRDTLCSDCFVKMLHQRLSSPYLPDTDHSDYLVSELDDIATVCSTSLAPLSTRPPPSYAAAPTPTPTQTQASGIPTASTGLNATLGAGNGTAGGANSSCPGQLVLPKPAAKRSLGWSFAGFTRDSGANTTGASNGTDFSCCNDLSTRYGVPTGDLQELMGSDNCDSNAPFCAPAKCTVTQVKANMTCETLAKMSSTQSQNVTLNQFLGWNSNIIGLCDRLVPGQYVCTSPPGGFATLPPSPLGANATAAAGNRMGGGSADSSSSAGSASATSSASASASGSGGSGSAPAPTSTDSPSSTTSSASGPATPTARTPDGTLSTCKTYAQPKSGQSCPDFAKDNGASPDDLYKWNPVLGAKGEHCETALELDSRYCVGA